MGITVKEIKPHVYLIRFYHIVDLRRVLDTRPWSFNGHTLILYHLQPGEDPLLVHLTHVPFWVQVYELPPSFMSIGAWFKVVVSIADSDGPET